jgi:hypothetical protein
LKEEPFSILFHGDQIETVKWDFIYSLVVFIENSVRRNTRPRKDKKKKTDGTRSLDRKLFRLFAPFFPVTYERVSSMSSGGNPFATLSTPLYTHLADFLECEEFGRLLVCSRTWLHVLTPRLEARKPYFSLLR